MYSPLVLEGRETKFGRFPFVVYNNERKPIEDLDVYNMTLRAIDVVSNQSMSVLLFPAEQPVKKD